MTAALFTLDLPPPFSTVVAGKKAAKGRKKERMSNIPTTENGSRSEPRFSVINATVDVENKASRCSYWPMGSN